MRTASEASTKVALTRCRFSFDTTKILHLVKNNGDQPYSGNPTEALLFNQILCQYQRKRCKLAVAVVIPPLR